MANAYIVVLIQKTRPEGWDDYRREVSKLIADFGGRYLVQGGPVETLEGGFDDHQVVVIEFPSMDRIRQFWNSEAYRRVKSLRERSGILHAWAVPGA